MTETSAIYRGEVMHHRSRPRQHHFSYRIDAFLFDLDRLEPLEKDCRWFSLNRFNLFSLYYRDIGSGDGEHPRAYLQQLLQREGFSRNLAGARLLCYPRILGYTFNPLSVYYCYDEAGDLFALVYEVSNTFGERHSYLLAVDPAERGADHIQQSADKAFYVSPFMGMDQRYEFHLNPPGDSLKINIRQFDDALDSEQPVFCARFDGHSRPFDNRQLLKTFFGLPLMTLKVTTAIHWEALKLWLKGLPLQRRKPTARHGLSTKSSSP